MEENGLRIYKPGDIAPCFTFVRDDNMTTDRYEIRLVRKTSTPNWGVEVWDSITLDPYDETDRHIPIAEIDEDELRGRNIVTNVKLLNKLEQMARDGSSWMELSGFKTD